MHNILKYLLVLMLATGFTPRLFAHSKDTTIVLDGKTYTLYRVKPGETLYAIAQAHGVELAELLKVNRLESGATVSVDELLIIPLYAKEVKEKMPAANDVPTPPPTPPVKEKTPETPVATETTANVHVVKAGETLYHISTLYHTTPDAIKALNKLTGNSLTVGQQLKIPGAPPVKKEVASAKPAVTASVTPKEKPVEKTIEAPAKPAAPTPAPIATKDTPKPVTPAETTPTPDAVDPSLDMKMLQTLKSTYETQVKSKGTVEAARGVATLMQEDNKENQSKFYALHKDAPVGTVMKVRNMMNNKTAYVKVIGKLPDTSDNQNVIIKVSAAAGKLLNVLDQKFQCEVTSFKLKE